MELWLLLYTQSSTFPAPAFSRSLADVHARQHASHAAQLPRDPALAVQALGGHPSHGPQPPAGLDPAGLGVPDVIGGAPVQHAGLHGSAQPVPTEDGSPPGALLPPQHLTIFHGSAAVEDATPLLPAEEEERPSLPPSFPFPLTWRGKRERGKEPGGRRDAASLPRLGSIGVSGHSIGWPGFVGVWRVSSLGGWWVGFVVGSARDVLCACWLRPACFKSKQVGTVEDGRFV